MALNSSSLPLASVIIDNYNYGRFLAAAIDSALGQTHPRTEVIVVDDGSTDNSRDVIARYGERVIPVLKSNGGMDTAFNAGFAASRGDVILFLDADDVLLSGAVAAAVAVFAEATGGRAVSKVHWPLWEIDQAGRRTGALVPHQPLREGDLRGALIGRGPDAYLSPPTSGNAWARRFVSRVFPMPEDNFKRHAEVYLATLAPVFGAVRALREPLSLYRMHGGNDYATRPAEEKNRRSLRLYEHRCRVLAHFLRATGADDDVDAASWMTGENSAYAWMCRLDAAAAELKALIPPGATFILADECQLADGLGGSGVIEERRAVPFVERNGQYWGAPPDDATAVAELERLRAGGATFFVFAWPAFWWREHYRGLVDHLHASGHCLADNERLVVFELPR